MTIGDRIREIRKNMKRSQESFGDQIGISGAAVSKLESGINTPTAQTIKSICSTYNVNKMWLETGEGEIYDTEDDEELEIALDFMTESEKAIFRMAHKKLTEDDWKKLYDLLVKLGAFPE